MKIDSYYLSGDTIRLGKSKSWTDKEWLILADVMDNCQRRGKIPKGTFKKIHKKLPHRTPGAIKAKMFEARYNGILKIDRIEQYWEKRYKEQFGDKYLNEVSK